MPPERGVHTKAALYGVLDTGDIPLSYPLRQAAAMSLVHIKVAALRAVANIKIIVFHSRCLLIIRIKIGPISNEIGPQKIILL